MEKIATTIEQGKKLLELGIDPNTADMFYEKMDNEEYDYHLCVGKMPKMQIACEEYVPAWSLSALLNLLPLSIPYNNGHCRYFLEWIFWNDNSLRYIDPPYADDRKYPVDIYSDHDEKRKDFIDTAFKMLCCLKRNKWI